MRLYLIRHGIAEPRGRKPDAERALTTRGRERLGMVVRGLEALGVRFDVLWHSPLVRAAQTAELLGPRVDKALRATDLLAAPPSAELLRLLRGNDVALVGHSPWLNELAAWLCCGEKDPDRIELKKCGVALLDGQPAPGRMMLRMLLPPRVLRRLG